MKYNLFINIDNLEFIITNKYKIDGFKKIENNCNFIFGYCFIENDVFKNEFISDNQYNLIISNKDTNSGIYLIIRFINNKIYLLIDPLVQYNLFYYCKNNYLTISSNIFEIAKIHNLYKEEEKYIEDNIIYSSPMRGLTLIKDIFIYQYDDMFNKEFAASYKSIIKNELLYNIELIEINNKVYKRYSYEELLTIYINNLKNRAKVLSNKYDKVFISLTGGADSRLVTSIFLDFDNIYHYCYGDGKRQDRLVFEMIVSNFNLKKEQNIKIVGNKLHTYASCLKNIQSSNAYKLSMDLVFNGKLEENICGVTGYYGVNICGSVNFPDINNFNIKYKNILNHNNFNHFSYVENFIKNKSKFRHSVIKDLFYLNNRGLSHYSCHSILENKYGNTYDILYDPINLEIIQKCKYNDVYIDKNVVSVDVISRINSKLALLPYENRIIPTFKYFPVIPIINCFELNTFGIRLDVNEFNYIRPQEDQYNKMFLNDNKILNFNNIINEITDQGFIIKYKNFFNHVIINKFNNHRIISTWILGVLYLNNLKILC